MRFFVNVINPEFSATFQRFAFKNGWNFRYPEVDSDGTSKPQAVTKKALLLINGVMYSDTPNSDDEIFDIATALTKVLEYMKPVEMKLNSDYDGLVCFIDKTVSMGCQTVTFDKVNELHTLIHSKD